jgi:adenylate cyclase
VLSSARSEAASPGHTSPESNLFWQGQPLDFRFGEFEIDLGRHELRRGGQAVRIEPQVFDLLLFLIRNRDRVVSKDELIDAIWQGRVISEAALSTCISAARRAVGDSGESQRLIRTLPKRGFRFVGAIEGEPAVAGGSKPVVEVAVAAELLQDVADAPKLALPDKPSIAVLPFQNLSGDPQQEYFADGLTEDIITELSRHHELFVISRNSSFVYKNRAVNVREVAEKLGAQYLVEGSVRKIGDRVRVTVQLIDTANDAHIWADKYDRKLDDIFAIQDEVTAAIAATLPGRVEAAQRDQLARAKPANMAAYECVLAAKVLHHRSTIADNERAQTLIDRAVALDPDYAHAHAWRACILGQAWVHNWIEERDAAWNEIVAALDRALALDDNDADVHRILAAVNVNSNELTTARYHQERALALNPNYDLVVVQQGELLTWLGRPEEGIEWIRRAMQLNPHHPERFWSHLGKAHFAARQYGEAIEAFMHLSTMDSVQHAFAAACYGWLGDEIAAAAHVGKIRTLDPQFDLDSFIETLHYAQHSDVQHIREGLLKAGIAEERSVL